MKTKIDIKAESFPWQAKLLGFLFLFLAVSIFLAYWWLAVPRGAVRWADIPSWTWYPLAYFGYLLGRGAITGAYPYPFVDPTTLGYPRALANGLGMLGGFCLIGAVLTGIKRVRSGT